MILKRYLFSALIILFLLPIVTKAQIVFDNGPIFNSAGTGAGGANESVLYTTTFAMGTIGFGQQLLALNRIADDFVITSTTPIDSIALYAYQTNSGIVSTINNINFRIWNGPPDSIGSTIVFGDTTTNRLTSTSFTNTYRITETTVGNTSRPIMRNLCATPGLTLSPGTYWIDWQTGGTLASGPWQPARVPAGVSVTGNGKQKIGGVWNFAVDGGTGAPAQGFPFVLYGTVASSLTSTPLTFPSVCVGNNNIQSTTITGGGLTGTSVVVGPLASFGFSTNPLGPFDTTVTLSYVGSTLSSIVYVQYLPLTAGSNNGDIIILGGGATDTISIIANANSYPTVTASVSAPIICLGSSTTFTGGGAATYTWSDGTNIPTDAVPFTPPAAGTSTYIVTGTDGNLCSATATVSVTVNPAVAAPTVSATPTSICAGGNTDLNAVSIGNTINWYDSLTAGTLLSTLPSATNYNVAPATTTTYYAEAVTPAGGTQTFSYTGNVQTFIVPTGVSSIEMECWGAQGGANWVNNTNFGGYSKGTIAVTPGETLTIYVGNQPTTISGGFNGGGDGDGVGRAGGGASDVRQSGTGLNNRIIVAGGGGGAGYWNSQHIVGGVGGGSNLSGGDGYRNTIADAGGKGATVLAAGANGTCGSFNNTNMAGAFGQGGSPATFGCGCEGYGGGGGWYGGAGSGNCRGGGGGSGYVIPSATNLLATSGVRIGDGQVTLTWTGFGCTSTARTPVIVTVNQPATFNSSTTLLTSCPTNEGGSILVSASSASTFAISPSGPTQPTAGIFASMVGGTSYIVTLTDGNMCTNTTMISATSSSNGELANTTATNATSTAGNSCGILTQNDNSTMNYYGASCDDLIATIVDASGGNVLGSVNACVTVLPTVPTYNGQPYLPRYYDITPTNQGPADITLYFTQDDFDDYNAAAGSFPQIPAVQATGTATFCISQVPGGFLPGASGATTIVHTVTATWNATNSRWEVTLPVTSFSGFYCHACNPLNSALPAAITNFKGTKTETTDLLTWTTTSELNNASFNILYSNDGKNYSRLTSVNSKASNGYSNVTLNYRVENTMPKLGHNYYKLEQVDIDGKSMINTQVVDLMWGTNGSTISVYPNPTSNELNIDIFTTKAENSSVKVLDMSGRILKEVQTKLQAGANSIQLSIGEFATGIYTIQILENNKITQVSKVEKQ